MTESSKTGRRWTLLAPALATLALLGGCVMAPMEPWEIGDPVMTSGSVYYGTSYYGNAYSTYPGYYYGAAPSWYYRAPSRTYGRPGRTHAGRGYRHERGAHGQGRRGAGQQGGGRQQPTGRDPRRPPFGATPRLSADRGGQSGNPARQRIARPLARDNAGSDAGRWNGLGGRGAGGVTRGNGALSGSRGLGGGFP